MLLEIHNIAYQYLIQQKQNRYFLVLDIRQISLMTKQNKLLLGIATLNHIVVLIMF